MSADQPSWASPSLSTGSIAAAVAYRAGIAALIAGTSHAKYLLALAVAHDPAFCLARLAVSAADAAEGLPFRHVTATNPLNRGERQHLEAVEAAFIGDHQRAEVLRREHLIDFPGDLLVVWLPVLTKR